MITENPHITVQIKPKNCGSESDSNSISGNNSWNVDTTNGQDGRISIQKQVRFSCPNDGSNEDCSCHSFWQNHVATNRKAVSNVWGSDDREKRSREIMYANMPSARKKVGIQLPKNIRDKLCKNWPNSFSEYDCRKFSSDQTARKELRKASDIDPRKNTQIRRRVKIRDVTLAKEREATEKEISLTTRENCRLSYREISRDKDSRNGFQKNMQRKLQNSNGPKIQYRKNTTAGHDLRKSTKKSDTKKVANKILTTSIKHFAKYIEACLKQHNRSDKTKNTINKQNSLGNSTVDSSPNNYETANTISQENCGNDSEMQTRDETSKDTGNVEESKWKANQRRDDIEKIAKQIRHDLAKSLKEDDEEEDIGNCIQSLIDDVGIICDGSPFVKEGFTSNGCPLDRSTAQKIIRANSATKIGGNQRCIKDFRRRNSSYGEVRSQPRTQYRDSFPQSSIALFSPKKVPEFLSPSHRFRNTRESNRRCRYDGSSIWQKDLQSPFSDKLDLGFEKKDILVSQENARSSGYENSRIPTSKKCRDSIHALRNHSFKYTMDDPQKHYESWKYGKNDRDIFRKNYVYSAPKGNLEEIKHRIGIIGSKTDLGSLHRKGSGTFGAGYREAFHKIVRDPNESVGDGPEKSFWDVYRSNVYNDGRKAPGDVMFNATGNARHDFGDKSSKIYRTSQKDSRDITRKFSSTRKDFGYDAKKANVFEYFRSGDTGHSRMLPFDIRQNVSAERKKSSCIDSTNHISFEGKNMHDHRKNFGICSRKNEPSSKNVGDVLSRIFSSDMSKVSRFEHGKSVSAITPKGGWEYGVQKHRRSVSPKGRLILPAPSAALRFASFRTHSPENRRHFSQPHPTKSIRSQSHKNGGFSRTSCPEDSTKVSPNVSGTHSHSADHKTGRPKSLRDHSWKAFGTFPWPAQSVHSAYNVRHNPSRHVLGESKSSTLVSPASCHNESKSANVSLGLHRKERHLPRGLWNTSSGYRPSKRLEKTQCRPSGAPECVASHDYGDRRSKILAHRSHAARTSDEEDVDAGEEDPLQHVGEDVCNCQKFPSRGCLRAVARNSYPWVVRSTWGIQGENLRPESVEASPQEFKASMKDEE